MPRSLLHDLFQRTWAFSSSRRDIAIALCRCNDTTFVGMLERRLRIVNLLRRVPIVSDTYKWERIDIVSALATCGSSMGCNEARRTRQDGADDEQIVLSHAIAAYDRTG